MESSTHIDTNQATRIDPIHYLRILVRRKWSVLFVVVLVVGATALLTLRTPRTYRAAASLIIEPSAPRVLDESQVANVYDDGSRGYWHNKDYFETQFKIITSRSVSARVVDKLGLGHDAAFLAGEPAGRDLSPAQRNAAKSVDAVALLQSRIRVEPVRDSRLVYVQVEDRDPRRAAQLANEVAEAYIAETLALKSRLSDNAYQWLEERRKALQDEARASELAVYQFRKDADLLSTSIENSQSMIAQRLGAISTKLTEVRTRIAALEAQASAVEAVKKSAAEDDEFWASAVPGAIENFLVRDLKLKYAEQKTQCLELTERYLNDHPKVLECRNRLETLKKELTSELDNIMRAASLSLTGARLEEKNLVGLLDETKAEAFAINKRQFEYEQLKREADNNQRLYDMVSKRLKDIELASMLNTSNARILDPAREPGAPIRPRVVLNIIVALVLGILAAIGLAFLAEVLDTTLHTQEQVEGAIGLSLLGILPAVFSKHRASGYLSVLEQSRSALAECARAIRTNLLFMSPEKPLRSILVTSDSPAEGKTMTAVSIAITMAESGSRVLLVDCDMRRPNVHSAFDIANSAGLSSLIMGQATVDGCVRRTKVNNLEVLTCGPVPPNPAELLHTDAFVRLIGELSARYDRVIIDSPPVGAVSDAIVVSTRVDGVVLVVKSGATSRDSARRMVRSLRAVNARILGAVLNHVDLNRPGYAQYYANAKYGYYAESETA